MKTLFFGLGLIALVAPALAANGAEPPVSGAAALLPMPAFRYETDWLKLPAGRTMGEVAAVAVDRQDHVWVLHRPRTVKDQPAEAVLPPIAEFDPQGRYLGGFGGPSDAYEWPTSEHTLAVSGDGHVWISGGARDKGKGDDMLLVFDKSGRFVRQIGHRGASKGNFDRENFAAPADIFIDRSGRQAYIADGYGNHRLVVLDSRSGRFRRMWSAYGKPPPKEGPTLSLNRDRGDTTGVFFNVHGVEQAADGRIYVADRLNQRIQVFSNAGRYEGQVAIDPDLPSPATASGMTFSRDPDQRYLFVADWGNGRMVVVDRLALKVIGSIGGIGTAPGQFKGPHLIDTDSQGVIYVAEVQGRRLQRVIPTYAATLPPRPR